MDDCCSGPALNRSQLLVRLLILTRQYTGYSKGLFVCFEASQYTIGCAGGISTRLANSLPPANHISIVRYPIKYGGFQCISATNQLLVPNILADSAKRTFRFNVCRNR